MPPADISRIIVFDDDVHQLHYRARQVSGVATRLLARDILQLKDGDVVKCARRGEAQEAIVDCLDDDPQARVLLIADMAAERNPFRGNVGARLVRGVAQRERTQTAVVRIVWTKQAVATIVEDLRPWLHATVAYSGDSTGDLADAVTYVLSGDFAGPRAFPEARAIERWRDDVRIRLEDLVGPTETYPQGRVCPADDVIALHIVQNYPDQAINAILKRTAGSRAHVTGFLNAVQHKHRLGSPEEARRKVEEDFLDTAEEHVADAITPDVINVASACLTESLAYCDDDQKARTTWLTLDELKLAVYFIQRYQQRVARLHGGNVSDRTAAINDLIGTPFKPTDRGLDETMQQLRLGLDDLAYALWTLKDVQQTV
jgi:hypothetical protein